MPQRFLKPGIVASPKWEGCSWMAQSFYVRLITLVDDWGRYEALPMLLRSQAFPIREDVTTDQVKGLIGELERNGLAVFYQHEGKAFLQLTNWTERPRSSRSKFPGPDNNSVQSDSTCANGGSNRQQPAGKRTTSANICCQPASKSPQADNTCTQPDNISCEILPPSSSSSSSSPSSPSINVRAVAGDGHKADGLEGAAAPAQPKRETQFKKPSLEEVKAQCAKTGLPESEGQAFLDHYESNGWRVGRTPMRSWIAALNTWKRNFDQHQFSIKPYGKPNIRNAGLAGDQSQRDSAISAAVAEQQRRRAASGSNAMAAQVGQPGLL